ncbi:MAG: methyltransferase domain-containing protein [Kiritimatiellae bacterium]|nr:methyltransferase domain-containing protein [Kiritimatiellia bacterium]
MRKGIEINEPDGFENVPCVLCGQENSQLLETKGRDGLSTYVSICLNDGLVYLNPRWPKERYASFYKEAYYRCHRPEALGAKTEKLRYGPVKEMWDRLSEFNGIQPINAVLDIGAGMGWSLDFIRERTSSSVLLAAIEPSAQCAQHLANHLNIKVLSNDVDSEWHYAEEGKYDLIIMRHVLEHFPNPVEALKKVRYALKEKGIVYMAVPNMMAPNEPL